jgi:hypothetical protein
MDEKFQYRRLPAAEKKIIDINPEKDVRIRIFGKVLDKADGTIIVDDGTSSATIVTDAACSIDDTVRVFARVLPLEDGYELRGEIVQIMNNLDMELYKKIHGEN